MKIRAPLATEREIELPIPSGMKTQRLNFGGGLFMRKVSADGKYFQFRMRVDSKEICAPLGKYPSVTLIEAKVLAEKLRSKVIGVRREIRDNNFLQNISKRKSATDKQAGCLKSIADVRNLFQRLSAQDQADEVYAALCLMVLIPVTPERLVKAKWNEFSNRSGQSTWMLEPIEDVVRGTTISRVQFLANKAFDIFSRLRKADSDSDSEFVFQSLSSLKRNELHSRLQSALDIFANKYAISASKLREAFREFSLSESQFRASLINETMLHKGSSRHPTPYQIQRYALANWWASEMEIVDG